MVPGCNCRDKRRQCQIDRIIPRRDDPHHAERNITDFGLGGPHFPACLTAFRFHPALEIVQGIINFGKDDTGFTEQGFVQRAIPKIRADGLRHFIQSCFEPLAQALQVVQTLLIGRAVFKPCVTQALE